MISDIKRQCPNVSPKNIKSNYSSSEEGQNWQRMPELNHMNHNHHKS